MSGILRVSPLKNLLTWFVLLVGLLGCSNSTQAPTRPGAASPSRPSAAQPSRPTPAPAQETIYPIMLGIDVLEAQGFAAIKGKRVGLLTHPAGVNRRGESSIDVLRRAPGVQLAALFGPEHGIYGNFKAATDIADSIDSRTGLPVYSLHGAHRKPTKQMLAGLDAMVIDLQDIGTRSYTFVSCMLYTMAACFENNVEVIVLDRPNPLGGLKVDGPPLDAQWKSYVGAFRAPYVHGLTIGEIARMAKEAPGVMQVPGSTGINVSETDRRRGRLTIISMKGWRRSMRWPETGLKWIPTSQYIQDFASVIGYPMTGLGTELGQFSHGFPGPLYPFRGISHPRINDAVLEKELRALNLPGLNYRRISVPNRNGKPVTGLYVEVTDWQDWNPTELNFHMMRLACKYEPTNPFAAASSADTRRFLIHMGSTDFFNALKRDGARVNVEAFLRDWRAKAKVYQQQTRRYWLYY